MTARTPRRKPKLTSVPTAARTPFRVAAVQMVSGDDVARQSCAGGHAGRRGRRRWRAARRAARNISACSARAPPTSWRCASRTARACSRRSSPHEARRHGIWLVGGTVPVACADPARVRSACLVYGPDGSRVARYDKIHLFAFARGEERYDEGRTIEAGRTPVAIDLPCGRVGLSVCYDLRFPELYRKLGELSLILVPSAFTATTGVAHWHLLLRARAVENQCYVLAAAQGGTHPGGRRTYGHSVLIDPWGRIVAEREEGPGIVVGDVDPARIAEVREQLPALTHRVL